MFECETHFGKVLFEQCYCFDCCLLFSKPFPFLSPTIFFSSIFLPLSPSFSSLDAGTYKFFFVLFTIFKSSLCCFLLCSGVETNKTSQNIKKRKKNQTRKQDNKPGRERKKEKQKKKIKNKNYKKRHKLFQKTRKKNQKENWNNFFLLPFLFWMPTKQRNFTMFEDISNKNSTHFFCVSLFLFLHLFLSSSCFFILYFLLHSSTTKLQARVKSVFAAFFSFYTFFLSPSLSHGIADFQSIFGVQFNLLLSHSLSLSLSLSLFLPPFLHFSYPEWAKRLQMYKKRKLNFKWDARRLVRFFFFLGFWPSPSFVAFRSFPVCVCLCLTIHGFTENVGAGV